MDKKSAPNVKILF